MSRKKPPEKKTPGFSHTPFSPLKGFAPARSSSRALPEQPSRRSPADHVDDDALFRQAMSGVQRHDRGGRLRGRQGSPSTGNIRQEMDDRSLFLSAMQSISAKSAIKKAEEEAPERRSQPTRARQLRRGDVSIPAELDLHGFRKEEALFRLEHFLANSAAKRFSAVLVITGKGVNSPDGPVLRNAVARWLRERGRGLVAEFTPAPPDKGGSGAFVVFLKSRRS